MQVMLSNDQLTRERTHGRAFKNFEESAISFPPTFKYDFGTQVFDTSPKQRVPSWTDRVLFKVHKRYRPQHKQQPFVVCSEYTSLQDVSTSDHKPVVASISVVPGKLALRSHH